MGESAPLSMEFGRATGLATFVHVDGSLWFIARETERT